MKHTVAKWAIVGVLALAAPLALAQTTTDTTTPGSPNTGAGGDAAQNFAVLAVSGAAMLGAAAYLARRKLA